MKRATLYKRGIAISVALMCGLAAAYAGTTDTYYDLVRPNGQPRSDAIFDADLDFCYGQTGASRSSADTPAFKQCMLGRKWRWESVQTVRDPSAPAVTYNRDSKNPNIGWHWENGWRVCHQDCDNPPADTPARPGSGYTCKNVQVLGMPMRECTSSN
jgi:hypothetical protein